MILIWEGSRNGSDIMMVLVLVLVCFVSFFSSEFLCV
jgi:hypothetical protein